MMMSGSIDRTNFARSRPRSWVQLGCSYWFYVRAIKHVTALEALLVPVIEPVLNPIWVLLVFGEKPTPLALAGGMIVITAITVRSLISIRDRRHAQVAG